MAAAGDTPPSAPAFSESAADRAWSTWRGGAHHGHSITLDQPRLVGRLLECDITSTMRRSPIAMRAWNRMPKAWCCAI
jgi:hypothetical protein